MTDPYRAFLEAKIRMAPTTGFDVADEDVNPLLKPHQRAIVRWAVRGGRRAIFATFGLGKSVMQIEALRLILERAGGRVLIVAPLGVRREFVEDVRKLATGDAPGIDDAQRAALRLWQAARPGRVPTIRFIRSIEEAGEEAGEETGEEAGGTGLFITNYETVRDGKLDPNLFTAVSLDEAAVLRSFGSKTYQTFLRLFDRVPHRFVATATPNPNRLKELIHYAGFLGIMDTGQALTRWFQRDSTKANNLTLFPHKADEFWMWVASWAVVIETPSDLGFPDDGYVLPDLVLRVHTVSTRPSRWKVERDGQGQLIEDAALGVQDAARAKRDSLSARVAKLREIVAADPTAHRVLWHDLEDERRAIEAALPGVVSVYGTQDLEVREDAVAAFSDGRVRWLAAKPVLCGAGCNFQRHCHKAVFLGIGHKFHDFIQAVHRLHRFLQTQAVEIDVIVADTEVEVWRDLERKWAEHREMVRTMVEIVRKHGLDHRAMAEVLSRTIGVERVEASGQGWTVALNDTVEEARRLPDDGIDLIVTSIPFANHYEYSAAYEDFGHTDDNDHFWRQMDHLTPELFRALRPGRLACVHTKDRVLFGNVTGEGVPTVSPFHAETIFHLRRHGFQYMGLIHVNTDVVRENNQTYRLGYTEMRKDGTKMGVGCPEYVVLARKPQTDRTRGYADDPVVKAAEDYSLARWQIDAHAFWRSSGDRLPTPEELAALPPGRLAKAFTEWSRASLYDHETHVRIGEALEARGCLPSTFMALAPGSHDPSVWDDVNRMLTLNTAQAAKGRELHVCPLQFDIVDRLIRRYSNPGDLVYDPFGGLFTVVCRALKLGRRGRAVELNRTYFLDGVKHIQATEAGLATRSLFDLWDPEAPAVPAAAE